MTLTDAAEPEEIVIEPTPTDQVLEIMNDFLMSQRTLLRLVDYITARQSDIDNRRDRVSEFARSEYAGVSVEAIDGLLKGFEELTALVLSFDEQPTADDMDVLKLAVAALVGQGALPDEESLAEFITGMVRARSQDPSTPVLLSSLLITLVGDFEMLIGSLARTIITLHPGALEASDRTFTWKEIAAHSSLDAVKEQVIDRAVDDLLRDSNEGWMKFFESKYKIAIPALAREQRVLEVFQRRNVVVHVGGKVSRQYLEKLAIKDPPNIGDKLVVDSQYMREAADLLCIVALALVHNAARKILPKENMTTIESTMANVPYRLLQDERYFAAKMVIAEQSAYPFESDYTRLVVRINGWLAAKRLGELETCRAEIEAWQISTLAPIFHLAKHALLDDFEKGHALVLKLRGGEELPVKFWLTWPLLDELRKYEQAMHAIDMTTARLPKARGHRAGHSSRGQIQPSRLILRAKTSPRVEPRTRASRLQAVRNGGAAEKFRCKVFSERHGRKLGDGAMSTPDL